jgi:hypothetical protein
MVKKYTFMRVERDTHNQIKNRVMKMNEDLKIMGVKRRINQVQFLNHLSKRLFYISDKELLQMTMRRRNKQC